MARYILINAIPGLRAGSIFDTDQGQNPDQARSQGGHLVQLPMPALEEAGAYAQRAYERGGGDALATGVMLAALAGQVLPPQTILWKPSGGGDARTWDDVMVRLEGIKTPAEIWLPVNETFTIPADATRYALGGTRFVGRLGGAVEVDIEDGATLLDCGGSYSTVILRGFTTSDQRPSFDYSAFYSGTLGAGLFLGDFGGYWKQQGSAPLVVVPENAFFVFAARNGGGIDQGGIPGQEVIRMADLSTLILACLGSPFSMTDNFLIGPGSATVLVQHDGSAQYPDPATHIPGFSGLVVNAPFGKFGGSGPSAFRPLPALGPLQDGLQFYDDDLKKPIWWNLGGLIWLDAASGVVP